MELNHHIMAKVATDAILCKFKSNEWSCTDNDGLSYGQNFVRTNVSADFPSPDASFVDAKNQIVASFEFKPPTETKRGILTGLGQTIAYLDKCSISFLIIPSHLDGYPLGSYMKSIFDKYISNKLPVGLVVYNNNDASQVNFVSNIKNCDTKKVSKSNIQECGRYWAKHQDLPLPLFHLVLYYFYQKKTKSGPFVNDDKKDIDAFATCWSECMISKTVAQDFMATRILDVSGKVIKTMQGDDKTYLGDTIAKLRKEHDNNEDISRELILRISTSRPEICKKGEKWGVSYKAVRKNILSFMKHLHVIDSSLMITEKGIKLYHLGVINGLESKIFIDYFTKEVLTTGKHIDLLIDFDNCIRNNQDKTITRVCKVLKEEYKSRGLLKLNEGRMTGDESQKGFLSYEITLWRHLQLLTEHNTVNFKRILEVCTLPEL